MEDERKRAPHGAAAAIGGFRTLSNGQIVRRLLALAWRYRGGCLRVVGLQVALLGLGITGLSFVGLAIDVLHVRLDPAAPAPAWPLGLEPPAHWPDMATIALLAGLILLFALLRAVLSYGYTVAMTKLVQQGLVVDLRARVYDKLQRLSFRFFDANASGTLINRITGDVQAVRSFVDGVVIQTLILLISLCWYLGYMLHIHPGLTVACLAQVPLIWCVSVIFARKVRPYYTRNRELADDLVLNVSETTQGIHVVKGFAREPEMAAGFAAANRELRDQKRRVFWAVTIYSPTVELLSQVSLVVLLLYGGWLVMQGRLPLGSGLIVFLGLLQRFSAQVNTITGITDSIQQSLAAAQRVFEVLDMPLEVASAPHARPLGRAGGALRFSGVHFGYVAAEPVLRDISFEAQPGQCVAILGTTGSGKSTLLSLIPRFYDATAGCVSLDGVDVRDLRLDDLRRQIGLVFQESFLFSNTVAANIAFGCPGATPAQIEQAARRACAHDFIARMPQGYQTILGEGGMDLSGGQRQRLAIARALLLEPPILLLDDPTAAVDAQTEQEILEAVDSAMQGRTTLLVTHRMSVLRRADLVLVLHQGRIVQRGRHAELLREPGHYRRVARLQEGAPAAGVSDGGEAP